MVSPPPRVSRATAAEVARHAKARKRWPGVTRAIDDAGGRFAFDASRADLACEFFPTYLRHFEGSHAGKPFELLDWQRELLVRPLFGWMRPDGSRRFRRVFVEVAKKNGKSGLCSGLALLLAFADGEAGAQVYCAAGAEDQARIVFRPAAEMARNSPELLADFGVEVLVNSIEQASTSSMLAPLTSKARSKHGFNIHGLIFDELHAQRDRELWDTLYKGISARRQPVVAAITTAGSDRESICREEYERACRVRDGVVDDDEVLPVVFEIDPERDDWTDERTWRKANPSLGETKSLEYMRAECRAALDEPRKRNSFLNLELNVWTESRTAWITPEAWAACAGQMPALDALPCCGGLDLSSSADLTALVLAFKLRDPKAQAAPGSAPEAGLNLDYRVALVPWFWIPEEAMAERVRRDRVPYDVWEREGWLRVTEGNVVDYAEIHRAIRDEIRPRFRRLHEIGFDPWNASHLSSQLVSEGVPMVEVRQGYGSLSGPSKLLEALVKSRRLVHDGNAVMRWCAANVEVKADPAGNIKPVKPGGASQGTRRIDGVAAAVTALARLMVMPDRPSSPYATRGVRSV